MKALSLENSGK